MQESTFVYIVGTGHCGSTLLSLILGSHSEMVSVGEMYVLEDYIESNKDCTCGSPILECNFWKKVLKNFDKSPKLDKLTGMNRFDFRIFNPYKPAGFRAKLALRSLHLALRTENSHLLNLERHFSGKYKNSLEAVEKTLMILKSACCVSGKRIVVDSSKSPLRMKTLYLASPENTRVIHLVRDGRSYIESMKRRRNYTAETSSSRWLETNKIAVQMKQTIPESQQLLVRYEDLCNDPIKCFTTICHSLGLNFEPNMLNFKENEHHDIRGNAMRFGGSSKIKINEVWKNLLGEKEKTAFKKIAGNFARSIGYEV